MCRWRDCCNITYKDHVEKTKKKKQKKRWVSYKVNIDCDAHANDIKDQMHHSIAHGPPHGGQQINGTKRCGQQTKEAKITRLAEKHELNGLLEVAVAGHHLEDLQ